MQSPHSLGTDIESMDTKQDKNSQIYTIREVRLRVETLKVDKFGTRKSILMREYPYFGADTEKVRQACGNSYHVIIIKCVGFDVADSAFYNVHMIGMS